MNKNWILKNKKLVEGVVLFLTSTFLIFESLKLHNNKSWALSPALFPLIITLFILVLSVVLMFKGLREKKTDIGTSSMGNSKKLGLVLLISFLYLIALPRLHFLLSSMLYLLFFLLILGERKWLTLVSISVLTPIFIEYIFSNLLNVYLP